MPEDLAWKLLELGRVIDPPKTAALFAPLQQKEPYQGVKIERDVKYGPADRNLLDVFMPETAAPARPVLIFIHGGGFVAGNKRTPGSPFYDNVMLWAVNNGFVGVNATYRLAPQSPYPAGAEDLAAVVAWVADKIGERGGDPARIYLMGHSAGAVHVANYVSHPEFHKVKDGGLAGAVMVSGIYDLTASPLGDRRDRLFRLRPIALCRALLAAGSAGDEDPADDRRRRTRPAALRRTVQFVEAGHLQGAERLRARDHAAAAQSHVGGVFDQRGGDAA